IHGNADAPVTIVEFSDFQCPFCSRAATTVEQLEKEYAGKVKIAYKQFPLPMHPRALPAAQASMCVNEQGADKFWKWYEIMFNNQDKMEDSDFAKYAQEAGADPAKFKSCYDSKKYAAQIEKDVHYGEQLGVKSTPTFFINGQLIAGAVPISDFKAAIDDALAD